jgi:Trypsin-like peptidase domain
MRILAAAVGSAMILVGCGHQAQSAPATSKPELTVADSSNRVIATSVDPDPRVGAVFLSGSDLHACTGSVLHSAAGNLVLTAAHCLSSGALARFVPGFARKATPDDFWTVDTLYLDPRWLANQDPLADYAIARVSRPGGGSVEGLVGSALSLGTAPARGSRVNVVAYPAGVGGLPIGCQASTGLSAGGYPELPCAGLVDGTSGAPWISGSTVTGVIGGLHGGGCAQNLSYSSPFDQRIAQLFARAQAGGPGDPPPSAYDDEC